MFSPASFRLLPHRDLIARQPHPCKRREAPRTDRLATDAPHRLPRVNLLAAEGTPPGGAAAVLLAQSGYPHIAHAPFRMDSPYPRRSKKKVSRRDARTRTTQRCSALLRRFSRGRADNICGLVLPPAGYFSPRQSPPRKSLPSSQLMPAIRINERSRGEKGEIASAPNNRAFCRYVN